MDTHTNPDNAVLGRKRRSNEVKQNNIPRYFEEKEIPTTKYENVIFQDGKELKIGNN